MNQGITFNGPVGQVNIFTEGRGTKRSRPDTEVETESSKQPLSERERFYHDLQKKITKKESSTISGSNGLENKHKCSFKNIIFKYKSLLDSFNINPQHINRILSTDFVEKLQLLESESIWFKGHKLEGSNLSYFLEGALEKVIGKITFLDNEDTSKTLKKLNITRASSLKELTLTETMQEKLDFIQSEEIPNSLKDYLLNFPGLYTELFKRDTEKTQLIINVAKMLMLRSETKNLKWGSAINCVRECLFPEKNPKNSWNHTIPKIVTNRHKILIENKKLIEEIENKLKQLVPPTQTEAPDSSSETESETEEAMAAKTAEETATKAERDAAYTLLGLYKPRISLPPRTSVVPSHPLRVANPTVPVITTSSNLHSLAHLLT